MSTLTISSAKKQAEGAPSLRRESTGYSTLESNLTFGDTEVHIGYDTAPAHCA